MALADDLRKAIHLQEESLRKAKALTALMDDEAFLELKDQYLNQRLNELLADRVHPHKQSDESQRAIMRGIDAIAEFSAWLKGKLLEWEDSEEILLELRHELDMAIENGDV